MRFEDGSGDLFLEVDRSGLNEISIGGATIDKVTALMPEVGTVTIEIVDQDTTIASLSTTTAPSVGGPETLPVVRDVVELTEGVTYTVTQTLIGVQHTTETSILTVVRPI